MKYSQFSKKVQSPLFTSQDVRLAGGKVFAYQLSLWQKQGHIVKLRNGIYLFSDKVNDLAPEEVGGALYGPSYVSLEKALLDLLYLNRIKDASGLRSLRINWRIARELINKDKFRQYLAKYSSKAMALIGALIIEKI